MQITRPQTPMGHLWNSIQSWLFPTLEDELGALDKKHRMFVAVCELCAPQDHMAAYRWGGKPACAAFLARQAGGCPPRDRLALCKAFIAKAVWDFATARNLIDAIRHRPALRRLCGWESLGDESSVSTTWPTPRTMPRQAIFTYRTPCGDRRRRATRGVLQEPHPCVVVVTARRAPGDPFHHTSRLLPRYLVAHHGRVAGDVEPAVGDGRLLGVA
jgi:hypothetical protein